GRLVAQAAAELYRQERRHLFDQPALRRLAEGGVQIDDMHPPDPCIPVRGDQGERIVGVDGFARRIPLAETDRSAVAQVNGRKEIHQTSPAIFRKLARSRRPASPLRSGWNWVPITRP